MAENNILTPEEELEFKLLQEMSGSPAEPAAETPAPEVEVPEPPEERSMDNILLEGEEGAVKAVAAGFAQEVSLGWEEEARSAVATGIDFVTGETSFSEISAKYDDHLQRRRDAIDELKAKHPTAYTSGEYTGIATSLFTGGALFKAGGKAATKLGFTAGLEAVVGTGAVKRAITTFSQAGAAGVSYSVGNAEERLEDIAVDEALITGAVSGAFGVGVDKAMRVVAAPARIIGDKISKSVLGLNRSTSARKQLMEFAKKRGQTIEEYSKELAESGIIKGGDNAENVINRLDDLVKQNSKTIGNILNSADDIAGAKISTESLRRDLQSNVVEPLLNNPNPQLQKLGVRLSNEVKEIGTKKKTITIIDPSTGNLNGKSEIIAEDMGELSMSELYNLKKSYDEFFFNKARENSDLNIVKQFQDISRNLRHMVDDKLDDLAVSKKMDPGVVAEMQNARKDYQSYNFLMKNAVETQLHNSHKSVSPYFEIFKTNQATHGISALTALNPGAAMALAGVTRLTAGNQRVKTAFGRTMTRIARAIESGSDVGKMASARLGAAAGARIDIFRQEAAAIDAELHLFQNPLDRSLESIIENQDYVLNILDVKDPEMGKEFRKALKTRNYEQLSMGMDLLMSVPGVKTRLVKKGRGIDGKLYSKADISQALQEIRSSDISKVEKIKLEKALLNNNQDPQHLQGQIQNERQMQKQASQRNKSRPKY